MSIEENKRLAERDAAAEAKERARVAREDYLHKVNGTGPYARTNPLPTADNGDSGGSAGSSGLKGFAAIAVLFFLAAHFNSGADKSPSADSHPDNTQPAIPLPENIQPENTRSPQSTKPDDNFSDYAPQDDSYSDYVLQNNRAFTDPEYSDSAQPQESAGNSPDPASYAFGAYYGQVAYFLQAFSERTPSNEKILTALGMTRDLNAKPVNEPAYAYRTLNDDGSFVAIARAPVAANGKFSSIVCMSNGRKITGLVHVITGPNLSPEFRQRSFISHNGDISKLVDLNSVASGNSDCRSAMIKMKQSYNLPELGSPLIAPQP